MSAFDNICEGVSLESPAAQSIELQNPNHGLSVPSFEALVLFPQQNLNLSTIPDGTAESRRRLG